MAVDMQQKYPWKACNNFCMSVLRGSRSPRPDLGKCGPSAEQGKRGWR